MLNRLVEGQIVVTVINKSDRGDDAVGAVTYGDTSNNGSSMKSNLTVVDDLFFARILLRGDFVLN